jgi:hypothetical protein
VLQGLDHFVLQPEWSEKSRVLYQLSFPSNPLRRTLELHCSLPGMMGAGSEEQQKEEE